MPATPPAVLLALLQHLLIDHDASVYRNEAGEIQVDTVEGDAIRADTVGEALDQFLVAHSAH